MTPEEHAAMKAVGWFVECESPFEVRHEDGSFATGQAAKMVLHLVMEGDWYDDSAVCAKGD